MFQQRKQAGWWDLAQGRELLWVLHSWALWHSNLESKGLALGGGPWPGRRPRASAGFPLCLVSFCHV